jgi:hypothetical protein
VPAAAVIPAPIPLHQTTSVLTATTLIYARLDINLTRSLYNSLVIVSGEMSSRITSEDDFDANVSL